MQNFPKFDWGIKFFLLPNYYNRDCLKQNKNHLAIQNHHSLLELLFLIHCLYTVFLYFSTCNKQIYFEEWHVYLLKSNLCDKVKNKFMWVIPFAVFRVHEYCFHAYILTIIVQSILFSGKDSLVFKINSVLCFKFSSTYFDQSKLKQTESFGISYYNQIFFHDYNDLIKFL